MAIYYILRTLSGPRHFEHQPDECIQGGDSRSSQKAHYAAIVLSPYIFRISVRRGGCASGRLDDGSKNSSGEAALAADLITALLACLELSLFRYLLVILSKISGRRGGFAGRRQDHGFQISLGQAVLAAGLITASGRAARLKTLGFSWLPARPKIEEQLSFKFAIKSAASAASRKTKRPKSRGVSG